MYIVQKDHHANFLELLKFYEKFSENERQIIFDNFWKLGNKSRQSDFLIQCAIKGSVKRIRTKIISRRSNTYSYFLSYFGEKLSAVFINNVRYKTTIFALYY